MTGGFQKLQPATPSFNQNGIAQSLQYGDVYHSTAGALAQTQHVFLAGNGLPERWQGLSHFSICETGFGLGNNFLVTWLSWLQDADRSQRLHFVSFEAHPFQRDDLARMHEQTSAELQPLVQQLLAQWPDLLPGIHRLYFENERVTLTLVFGDIEQKAKVVDAQIDAFFLDGFAPRLNPQMWSRRLFGQLVRLSAKGATMASWCSAGQVRRDLQDAGFLIEKVPGFAHKREMIRGVLREKLGRQPRATPAHVLVVGAGIAGAATAAALVRRGIQVTVADPVLKDGTGASHLGHKAIAMTPLLSVDDAPRMRLSRAGMLVAERQWQAAEATDCLPLGTVRVAVDADEDKAAHKAVEALGFPDTWVQYLDVVSMSQQVGDDVAYGGLYFPRAMRVQPDKLIERLFTHPNIRLLATKVLSLEPSEAGWCAVLDTEGTATETLQVDAVALCVAGALPALLPDSVVATKPYPYIKEMELLPGQVSYFVAAEMTKTPTHIVAGEGYVLPEVDGVCTAGSTYGAHGKPAQVTEQGHQEIRDTLQRWRSWLAPASTQGGWAGYRAALKDHLPVYAGSDQSLAIMSGLGSNGFAWSAILAEDLAAAWNNEPRLLERDLSRALGLR
ncbi:tRNA (5-methylaminomethyl-2-thiouridine)(34)-methyltransferase MnmD [Paenalcaligenes sp. Me131]|uniref:tRNA (5-methylaminomethyl-2-thiouridine)(34)-methyltransferase MnmD n=1 Tax=Paenalcaligenes sp. Me131 TaxID=3392636 RepID=UPI003D299725